MRLLFVEDNIRLAKFIREGISREGLKTDIVHTAEDGLTAFRAIDYDMVILDLGLPDRDGLELLKDIRGLNRHVPVMILTARDSLEERVCGLNNEADDYVVKPVETPELVARIRALLRRPGQSLGTVLTIGNLALDTRTREATVMKKNLPLTRREVELLEHLMRSAGKAVAKEGIEGRLYGYGETGSANSVDVLMYRLRQKLEEGKADVQIHTLHGTGYLLTEAVAGTGLAGPKDRLIEAKAK